MKIINNKNILALLSVALIIIIWQIIYIIVGNEVIIPSIKSTIASIGDLIISKNFLLILIYTMCRVLIGFAISLILGIALGFIAGMNRNIEVFLKPYILVIRSAPIVALMVILLVWFKSENVPILANFLLCFPIIYENILNGIKNTDKLIIEYAKVHKIPLISQVKYIYIPEMHKYIISSIFGTLSMSWKTTVSAEIISIPMYGIGSSIYEAKVYLNTNDVFAWLIIIVFISFIFDFIIENIKRKMILDNKIENEVKYDS